MAAIDIAAKIRSTALAAIEAQCFGEDFGFDCAMALMPNPAGGVQVMYTLMVSMRSPLLGQGPMFAPIQMQSPQPDAPAVEKFVTKAMRELRETSRKLLSGAQNSATAAHN
jgi:hypothetical protein